MNSIITTVLQSGKWGHFKSGWTWITSVLMSFWISMPVALQSLTVLIIIDFTVGTAIAVKRKEFKKDRAIDGAIRKGIELLLIPATYHVFKPFKLMLSVDYDPTVVVMLALLLGEFMSIVNLCKDYGAGVPEVVFQLMHQMQAVLNGKWDGRERRYRHGGEYTGPEKRRITVAKRSKIRLPIISKKNVKMGTNTGRKDEV